MSRRLAMAAALVLSAACVQPSAGDPEAFCREVRRQAPSLLGPGRLEPPTAAVRSAAKALRELVPEALVDDVEVLASSDAPGELGPAWAAVTAYARSTCGDGGG